jgi:hypothetical protein
VRLAKKDGLPVGLASERIGVLLAEEAELVGLDQLVDRGRIGSEFLVVKLESALVLLSAVDRLQLFVALDGHGDLGRGDGQTDKHDHRHKNHHQENVA